MMYGSLQRITESQNSRGWQGPLWGTQPNPLPKQGHPEQAAQHRAQAGLEYLQRRILLSNLCPVQRGHSQAATTLGQDRSCAARRRSSRLPSARGIGPVFPAELLSPLSTELQWASRG